MVVITGFKTVFCEANLCFFFVRVISPYGCLVYSVLYSIQHILLVIVIK